MCRARQLCACRLPLRVRIDHLPYCAHPRCNATPSDATPPPTSDTAAMCLYKSLLPRLASVELPRFGGEFRTWSWDGVLQSGYLLSIKDRQAPHREHRDRVRWTGEGTTRWGCCVIPVVLFSVSEVLTRPAPALPVVQIRSETGSPTQNAGDGCCKSPQCSRRSPCAPGTGCGRRADREARTPGCQTTIR